MLSGTIPAGVTHVWTDGFEKPDMWWCKRLSLYQETPDGWLVWSEHTGWRSSRNESEWFEREKAEGYFITWEEYNGQGN